MFKVNVDEPTIHELFDLTGKTALVTGASGWLGSSFSRALAEAGATVVTASRDAARARQVADTLPTPKSQTHHAVALDQMDGPSIDKGFADAVKAAGQVDILINNGLDACAADITSVTFEDFARHQHNNAGYFILARHLRDHAVQRNAPANVVSLGSMYGQVASYPDAYDPGRASPVAYHALKGGTIHMTRHMAVYWAKDNVRVNCISPGPFPSPAAGKDLVTRLATKNPMQRMGKPHELKGALLLLVSEAGSFITGQNITIDGGWLAW
ncbi:MAG: short-chain dehydrogenase [Planctomycetaceae bacterium]|nr:short-chain dehydrogenase [Planctomycetaceae bacterium]